MRACLNFVSKEFLGVYSIIYLGARDAASIMYLYRVFMYHFCCNPTDNISHEILKN
jgi:hypothetical protein